MMMNGKMAAVGSAALIALLASLPATAADPSPRQLKKDLKQARKLWTSGHTAAALELYEGVLSATAPAAPERAGALYAVTLAALSPDSRGEDRDRALGLLDELSSSFPRHPRREEIRALTVLLEAERAAVREQERLQGTVDAQSEELDQVRQQTSGENESLEARLNELEGKLAQSEKKLAARSNELKATRDKLTDTEEAFKQLTERCARRSGR